MDNFHFTWSSSKNMIGGIDVCVDIYEVLRPSLVCDGKFLTRHHTRFYKRAIDDDNEINIQKCGQEYLTGQFTNNGLFQIPNTRYGNHKWDNLFSFYEFGPDYGGGACNPDIYVTLYRPIIKFIKFMAQSN